MPKLITNDSQSQQLPRAGGDRQGGASLFGGDVGRAVENLGRTVSSVGANLSVGLDRHRRIETATRKQEARRAATEAGVHLRNAVGELQLDPDLDGREKRFEAEKKRILSQFRPKEEGDEFDSFFRREEASQGGRLQQNTTMERIKVARKGLSFQLDTLATQVAEGDDFDSVEAAGQADILLEIGQQEGFIGAEEAALERQVFVAKASERREKFEFDNNIIEQTNLIMNSVTEEGGLTTLGERIEMARAIPDDKLSSEVVRRVRNRTNEEKAVERARIEMVREQSWDGVLNGEGERAIHPDLPAREQARLRKAVADQLKAKAEGSSLLQETDPEQWSKLQNMDDDEFAQQNLKMWPLGPVERSKAERRQKALHDGIDPEKDSINGNDRSFARRSMREAGITTTRRHDEVLLQYERAADEAQELKGLPLNKEEKRDLFRNLMDTKVSVPNSRFLFFDKDVPVTELTPEDAQAIISDRTGPLAAQALDEMRKAGVEGVTQVDIEARVESMLLEMGVDLGN